MNDLGTLSREAIKKHSFICPSRITSIEGSILSTAILQLPHSPTKMPALHRRNFQASGWTQPCAQGMERLDVGMQASNQ